MSDKKSKVIYLKTRKPSDPESQPDPITDDAKTGYRINQAAEACRHSGHYSCVPNCLYEIGLTQQEREIWLYFNRLEPWEHPRIEEIHSAIGIRKATVLTGIERLCELNMLVVEGEGKHRRFHIPHPIFWKHEIPRSRYAIKAEDEQPTDITSGLFSGVVKKRSGRNVPGGTKINVPGGTKKRSTGNENETKNVPGGTFSSQQTVEPQGLEAPLKTSSLRLNKTSLNPTDIPRNDSRGAGGGKVIITLAELEGAMLALYTRYTTPKVITALIKRLQREGSNEDILAMIERQRLVQQGMRAWSPRQTDEWINRLKNPEPEAENVGPVYTDWAAVEAEAKAAPKGLDDFPY